jgi:hypothetical protein
MKINHKLINKSKLASSLGITPSTLHSKMNGKKYHKFTPEQLEKLKGIYIELFEYLFEITTIEDYDSFVDEVRNYLFETN